ncbi:uncharacterized protein LOC122944806 [Bufo gargarizans]|uniref:uncharacterized protein LOC122944806 n=1 Tax=Bufo gargarizans TaxID=30331 RepID=UPI001CF4C794|nr:uncharacterized protein LOC122944806 [Bufo gargarizans]
MALSVRDDAFLQRLLHYSPEPRYVQVNLQLFGMPGHGKSSLINTCLRIVHGGSFENTAGSGRSNHPITMDRKDYRLTAKVLITDNRGVNKMSLEEQEEIAAQMSQLRGRDKVEWDRSLRQKVNLIREQFRNRPMEIIVPVFVYSAESLLTDERYEEMEPFIRGAHNITDIYPIVVLTKIRSHANMAAKCYNKFKTLGAVHIFQVENYTVEEHERNPETQTEVLKFLDTCLQEVDENISRRATIDPQYVYVHQAMEQVHNMIQKQNEKNEMKVQVLEEKCEKGDEEIRRMKQICDEKDRELRELRQSRKKPKCRLL